MLKNNLKPYVLEDKKQSAISRRILKVFFTAWDDCKLIKPIIVVVVYANKFENLCAPYKGICIKNIVVINFNQHVRQVYK